jgi:hypothetical protein
MTTKCNFKQSIAYQAHATKLRWHAQARAKLRALAGALELPQGAFEMRSNHGGIAVSGEATLHGEHVYIQVSQPFGGADTGLLYRRCRGRRDYTGERNHFASLNALHAIEALAAVIERDLGPCYKPNANEVVNG